jgi:hypothetical protein
MLVPFAKAVSGTALRERIPADSNPPHQAKLRPAKGPGYAESVAYSEPDVFTPGTNWDGKLG